MQKLSFFAIIYIGDFMTFASRERFKERKYSYMKKKELDEENPLLKLGKIIVFSPLLVFGTIGQIIDKNNNKKTINNVTKGKIYKKSVCIIANRHIHINTRDKKDFYEDQIVSVKINNNIINNVHIKIADNFALALHINKDDAQNNNIESGDIALFKED